MMISRASTNLDNPAGDGRFSQIADNEGDDGASSDDYEYLSHNPIPQLEKGT